MEAPNIIQKLRKVNRGVVAVDTDDVVALGVCVALFGAAYLFWRQSVNKAKQLKLEREMERKRRMCRGY